MTAAPVRRAKNARHRPSVQLCSEVVEWCWMVRKCEKCRPKILRIARVRSQALCAKHQKWQSWLFLWASKSQLTNYQVTLGQGCWVVMDSKLLSWGLGPFWTLIEHHKQHPPPHPSQGALKETSPILSILCLAQCVRYSLSNMFNWLAWDV